MSADPCGSGAKDVGSYHGYPPTLVTLRDGRRLMFRSIEPDDGDALEAAFHKLSEEARYMRFMAPLKYVSPRMLDRAVRPAGDHELALIAVEVSGDSAIVGAARYVGAIRATGAANSPSPSLTIGIASVSPRACWES